MSGFFISDFDPVRVLAPGAVLLRDYLSVDQQRQLVEAFRQWCAGPVPAHAPTIRGHHMSVSMVCVGWHWSPYRYDRVARDVNGQNVLPMPPWLQQWAVDAVRDVNDAAGLGWPVELYSPDTAIANLYRPGTKMGMHQDKDEQSAAPVVSFSVGLSCNFRFGNNAGRGKPYVDVQLNSGDLVVFGGASRFNFHGVTKIMADRYGDDVGLGDARLNVTVRQTGLDS